MNKIIFNSLTSTTPMCRLGEKHNTDKSPLAPNEFRHSYTILYDFLFGKLKYEKIKIAEVGIWNNAGIQCFREYFPNAEIYGFDQEHYLLEQAKSHNLPNTHYFYMNANDASSVHESFNKVGGNFDIIIDDASHQFEHQINIILNSVPYLKPGGVLIIEDVYKSIDESLFVEQLVSIEKYFNTITFIETEHALQYTGHWDNDKLLVMYRNDILLEN